MWSYYPKAAGGPPAFGYPAPGWHPPYGTVPARFPIQRNQPGNASNGKMDLKTLLESDVDLNGDVDALLTEEAKKEMDEHLDDLIEQEERAEAQGEVFVAALAEDYVPPQRNEGSASSRSQTTGQAAPASAGDESQQPSTGAASSSNPDQGASTSLPAAEDDSSSESEACDAEMKEVVPEKGTKERRVKRSVILTPAWRQGSLCALQHLRLKHFEEAGQNNVVELQLGQIKYSQDSIKGQFRDQRTLKTTRQQLESGRGENGKPMTLNDIPKISVVCRDGVAYSSDNRRLWTFKHCGLPPNTRIPVIKKTSTDHNFLKKWTTFNSGESIARRGDKRLY